MKYILIPLIISCGTIAPDPITLQHTHQPEQVAVLAEDLPDAEAPPEPEVTTEEFIEQSCGDELFAPGGKSEGDTFSYNTCQILKAIIECRKTDTCAWEQNK